MYAHTIYMPISSYECVRLSTFISLAFFIYWYFPYNIKIKHFSTSFRMSPIICCNILLQQNYLHNISFWFSSINTYLFVSSRHSSKLFLKKKNYRNWPHLQTFLFCFLWVFGYPPHTHIPPYVLGFKVVLFIYFFSLKSWMNEFWMNILGLIFCMVLVSATVLGTVLGI